MRFFSDNSIEPEAKRGGLDLGELHAFLGEGIQFQGDVTCAGTLRVDGCLEGQIVRSEVLVVGERGEVKAEIEVGRLVVSGCVIGNISARQHVELLRPSRVTGTIRTPSMVVVEGAVFDGKCEMASAAQE